MMGYDGHGVPHDGDALKETKTKSSKGKETLKKR